MIREKVNIHLFQGLILMFLIISGLLIIGPLRDAANKRAELIKDSLMTQLEANLGISLSYDSISPALLSAVTIRNLTVSFDQGNFFARRFRVFLNPFRGLKASRDSPSNLITRIVISGTHIDLELPGTDRVPSETLDLQAVLSLMEAKTIVLKNLSAAVSTGEFGIIEADDVSLQLEAVKGLVRYDFEGSLKSDSPLPIIGSDQVRMKVDSNGSYSLLESTFNGRVELLAGRLGDFDVEPIAVDLTYKDKQLSLQRINDEYPIDFSMRISEEGIDASGELENFTASDFIRPVGDYQSLRPWFDSVADGGFMISMNPRSNDISYDLDMTVAFPEEAGLPWPWNIDVDLDGHGGKADVAELTIAIPWGKAEYQGRIGLDMLSLQGGLSIEVDEELLGYPVEADFQVNTVEDVITAEPTYFTAGDLEFHDFSFLLLQDGQQYSLSLSVLPGRPSDTRDRHILFDAMLDMEHGPVIYGFAEIEGFEAGHAAGLLNAAYAANADIMRNALFNLRGFFEINPSKWMLYVEEASLVSTKNPENNVVVRGRITPGHWSLDGVRVAWDGYSIDGRGFSRDTEEGGFARGRLVIAEDLYPIEAYWTHNGPLRIVSSPGIEAVFGPSARQGRTMAVRVTQFEVPLKDRRLLSDFNLRGIVGRKGWEVLLRDSRFTLIQKEGGVNSSIQLTGLMSPELIEFTSIDFMDSIGELHGDAVFRSSQVGETLSGNLMLDSGGGESYRLHAVRYLNEWSIDLEVNSARMERLGMLDIQGYLDLQGNLTGSLDNPLVALDISTREGLLDASPFNFQGKANMDQRKLQVHELNLLYKGISVSHGLLLMNMEAGSVRTAAELRTTYNQIPVKTGFALGVNLGRSLSFSNFPSLRDVDFTGTLATHALMWNDKPHLPPLTLQFSRDSDSFIVQSPDKETLDAAFSFSDGSLEVNSGAPMPIAARGSGTIRDGLLNLRFRELEIDPVLVNYVMPRDPILLQYHVIFQGGRLVGNLDIQGPAASPDFYGSIRAVDLKADTPYTYADIQPTSSEITFEGNKISFTRTEVPVGDGIAYGEGYFVLDGWKLTEVDMTYGCLPTGSSDGVPVSYPLMGVYLDGLVTAEIRMTGSFKGLHLEGDIAMPFFKASLGSPQFPVRQRKPGKIPKPVTLDFLIQTGTNCSFYLPNEELKIVKATAEPGHSLSLAFNNNPRKLSLTGTLPVKSGDIQYFDRNFQITEGAMVFNEALRDFDPIMQLRAETRVRDEDNEEVTVALVYDAPVKSDFNPRIETFPARSEIEILALLGQVVAPYGESGGTQLPSVLLATGSMFAQVGLVQPFEAVLRKGLNLDMVTIQTDIIENTLAGSLNWNAVSTVSDQVTGLGAIWIIQVFTQGSTSGMHCSRLGPYRHGISRGGGFAPCSGGWNLKHPSLWKWQRRFSILNGPTRRIRCLPEIS